MVPSRRSVALLAGLVLVGCAKSDRDALRSSDSEVPVSSTERHTPDAVPVTIERRVAIDQLADPTIDLDLSEYTGVDLDTSQPPSDLTFCEAVAGAPSRWLNDAIVPLQFWVDAYGGVRDAPPEAAGAIESLLAYGSTRIAWNLGRAERPEFGSELAADAKTVADAAVAACPGLPLVLGRSGDFLADPWGGPIDDSEMASRCADDRAELEGAITRYTELFDAVPLHLEQLETGLLVHSEYFFGSDLHGIAVDESGQAVGVPVEVGPCSHTP